MVQPMSALPSSSPSGFSFLPVSPRGALASIASRMASAATATGATMIEVRVTGCSGGIAAVAGRLSSIGLPGKKRLSAHSVPAKKTASTAAPSTMARIDRRTPALLLPRPQDLIDRLISRHRHPSKPFARPRSGGESSRCSAAILRRRHVHSVMVQALTAAHVSGDPADARISSTLMFSSFTRRPYFSVSSCTSLAELPRRCRRPGPAPDRQSSSRTLASLSALSISALSRAAIAGGVPAGTNTPSH